MNYDLKKIMDEFYIYKTARSAKDRTAKGYIKALNSFFRWVGKHPRQVTIDDIDHYMVYLKVERKNSTNTQKLKQAAIRLFYRWYANRYHIPNPTDSMIPLPEEIKVPVMPTPDEFTRMVYACDLSTFTGRRDAALLCLLADTGIRRSECSALNVGNIQLYEKNYMCIVPRIKSRQRMVPFGELTNGAFVGEFFSSYYQEIKFVKQYKPDDPLFKQVGIRYKGDRLGPKGVSGVVVRYAKKAEIGRPITAHSFRHFFGTYSVIHGTPVHELRQLMGHAWLETTMRYVHIAELIVGNSLKQRATTNLVAPKQWTGFVANIKKIQSPHAKK